MAKQIENIMFFCNCWIKFARQNEWAIHVACALLWSLPKNSFDKFASSKQSKDYLIQLNFSGTQALADTNLHISDDDIGLCPPTNLPPTSSLLIISLPHISLPLRYSLPPGFSLPHLKISSQQPLPCSLLHTFSFKPSLSSSTDTLPSTLLKGSH